MINTLKIFLFISCIIAIHACEQAPIIHQDISQDDLIKDISTDIKITYSDSAKTKIILESPHMEHTNKPNNDKTIFPKGLTLTMYDNNGRQQSVLKCNYAEQLPRKNLVLFRGNVIWENGQGDKMETEEMFYDEKKSKMYSNKNTFVSFRSKGNTINGYGFESYDDFTHQKVYNIVDSVIEK